MNKKGISLTVLIITSAVMLILVSTIVISGFNTANSSEELSFAMEISSIQQSVNSYVEINDGQYPVKDAVLLDVSKMSEKSLNQFKNNNDVVDANGNILLYEIDYQKINQNSLKYGNGSNGENDMYVVSQATGNVYYAKGVKINDTTYFALTDKLIKLLGYNNEKNEKITNSAVVFIPSNTTWTNQNVNVVVKVPKKYTNVIVTAGNSTISEDTTANDDIYYVYQVSSEGNYQILVNYNSNENGEERRIAKYSVNNVDKAAPDIEIDVDNQVRLKDAENENIGYVKILSKKDDLSGIKLLKYDTEKITNDISEHFELTGKDIKGDTIMIEKGVRYITVYIEDNAGNGKAVSFDVKF